ncbi:hypothetical protein [Pelagivirga sediminicola]|uniref:hypothetical protein n=1 Tax=Pelagivirga sediminicola TaxID=2170575 RepID=UPI001056F980|nr:hypothetical protein [Pelagivirga sediminicola]
MTTILAAKITVFIFDSSARHLGSHKQSHQFGGYVPAKTGKEVGTILWAKPQNLRSLSQALALTFDPAEQVPRNWRIDVARMRHTRATQPMNDAEQFCGGCEALSHFRIRSRRILAHYSGISLSDARTRASS